MSDFNIAVPQDELDAKPQFVLPAGWYGTTLQAGAEIVGNDNGWKAVRVPFAGFTAKSEFVVQLNGVAGSPCDVYMTVKPRKRDGKVVTKEGTNDPVLDNEISRVAGAGQGK